MPEIGFALISDHFHPWIDRQGNGPFAWSVLGDHWPPSQIRLEMLDEADAGYEHIYIHQIGPDQEGDFRFYQREILPEFS